MDSGGGCSVGGAIAPGAVKAAGWRSPANLRAAEAAGWEWKEAAQTLNGPRVEISPPSTRFDSGAGQGDPEVVIKRKVYGTRRLTSRR